MGALKVVEVEVDPPALAGLPEASIIMQIDPLVFHTLPQPLGEDVVHHPAAAGPQFDLVPILHNPVSRPRPGADQSRCGLAARVWATSATYLIAQTGLLSVLR